MNFACAEKHYLIIVSKKEHAFLNFQQSCSTTLVLLISQLKLIERTENLKVDLNIELGRTVLSTIFTSTEGNMEPLNQFHAQKDGTEIIENIYSCQNRAIFKHN